MSTVLRLLAAPLAVFLGGCGASAGDVWLSASTDTVTHSNGPRSQDAGASTPDCFEGQQAPCETACGSQGTAFCGESTWSATCQPPAEVCTNGADDDCDGFADAADPECRVCTPGQTRSCTASCGSQGTQECETNGQWKPACRLPVERCDNGVDDDCDGRVDHADFDCPSTIYTCEDSEGGGCNGDMGYGDHCAAGDNTGGCSPQRFWAWCNRRNPAHPDIWDNWIRSWVDSRCDGALAETGTQYSTWYCTSSTNDRYECTTPLVLSFDGAPLRLAGPSPAAFSFAPGEPVASSWPRPENPWLVRDLNGNGRVDDGRELFGSNTLLASGPKAAHGFEALAELDQNRDGVVDAKDPAFASLRLWRDADGDRQTGPGELQALELAGVRALSLRFSLAPHCDVQGNCEGERADFAWVDHSGRARTGAVVDLYLRTRPLKLSPTALACLKPPLGP